MPTKPTTKQATTKKGKAGTRRSRSVSRKRKRHIVTPLSAARIIEILGLSARELREVQEIVAGQYPERKAHRARG